MIDAQADLLPRCRSYGTGPGLWRRLHAQPFEIHFIGASVTAQRDGWSDRFVKRLGDLTGQDHLGSKNTMGGVGLLFAVAHQRPKAGDRPRLVFIEYSTGDLNPGLTPIEQLPVLLDELVRRVRASGDEVVIVHNWRADHPIEDPAGVRDAYDRAARDHGLAVIDNHVDVHHAMAVEPALRDRWFRDVCHTNPEGADRYVDHVLACLQAMDSLARPPAGASPPRPWTHATIDWLAPSFEAADARGEYVYGHTQQRFAYGEWAGGAGFVLSGDLMGVAFLSGPRAGPVELLLDGKRLRRFGVFDRHSYYQRYVLLPAVATLDQTMVELKTDPTPVDFTIASQPHKDFALPRVMRLVHFIGRGLRLHG